MQKLKYKLVDDDNLYQADLTDMEAELLQRSTDEVREIIINEIHNRIGRVIE